MVDAVGPSRAMVLRQIATHSSGRCAFTNRSRRSDSLSWDYTGAMTARSVAGSRASQEGSKWQEHPANAL
jgi:hypothetical protein